MTIYFYSTTDTYGAFSNFAAYPFLLDGLRWPTSEHYFQAAKFAGTAYAEQIRTAKTPKLAAAWGRARTIPLRADWEAVKEDVMRAALRAKFAAHADIRQLLLDTAAEEIIEASPIDYYWGSGQDGTGRNRLGALLMELRSMLRESGPAQGPSSPLP